MRCEYLAYKVAQVWRISIQRGWENSSGKLFPGLLSLPCCSFGCFWTVSMHPISQRSHAPALNWRPTRHTALGMNPCAWKAKITFITGFSSVHLEVLHIPPAVQKPLALVSLKKAVELPMAMSALVNEMYQGNLWSCVPSITAVSWYNTSCTPIITLFSCSEQGGRMLTAHWKFFTHMNLPTVSGSCLGKAYLTWVKRKLSAAVAI